MLLIKPVHNVATDQHNVVLRTMREQPSVQTIPTVRQPAVGDVSVPCAARWRTGRRDVKWTFVQSEMFRSEFVPIPQLKTLCTDTHETSSLMLHSSSGLASAEFINLKHEADAFYEIHNRSELSWDLTDFYVSPRLWKTESDWSSNLKTLNSTK